MPLVRISLREGTSGQYRQALADGVHQAMVEAIEIPAQDRFQIITEHPANGLIYDPSYLGIERSDKIVLVRPAGASRRRRRNCSNTCRKFWRGIWDCARRICSSTWWKLPGRIGRSETEKRSTTSSECWVGPYSARLAAIWPASTGSVPGPAKSGFGASGLSSGLSTGKMSWVSRHSS